MDGTNIIKRLKLAGTLLLILVVFLIAGVLYWNCVKRGDGKVLPAQYLPPTETEHAMQSGGNTYSERPYVGNGSDNAGNGSNNPAAGDDYDVNVYVEEFEYETRGWVNLIEFD